MATATPYGNGYRAQYRDANNNRRWTPTLATKKLAEDYAHDQAAKVRQGTWLDPSGGKVTFSQYFEEQWFPNRGGEVNTRKTYLSHYNASLKETFGPLRLRQILPSTVQGWVARQEAEGVKASTIVARHKALQTVLAARKGASAMRDGLLATNPCHGTQLPTVEELEVQFYDPAEVQKILSLLDPWWWLMVVLASETGLRFGELQGLRVTDFGFGFREFTVRRTIIEVGTKTTGNGTPYMWKKYPKGKKQRRIALEKDIAKAIRNHVESLGLGPEDRLFSMPDRTPPAEWHPPLSLEWTVRRSEVWQEGVPIGRSYWLDDVWYRAVDKAGLDRRPFKAVRASYITWMLSGGANVTDLMKSVGHKDYDTTKRYVGVMEDADKGLLKAMRKTKRRYS